MNLVMLRRRLATGFRTFGYLMSILIWLWIAIITAPPLLESGRLDVFLPTATPVEPPAPTNSSSDGISPIISLTVGVITLLMIALTAVVLWRLPRTVVTKGDRLTETMANTILPVITHHQKLPARRRRQLGRRLVGVVQIAAVVIPLFIVFMLPVPAGLTQPIITMTGTVLSGAGVASFILAYGLDVPMKKPTSRTRSRGSRE